MSDILERGARDADATLRFGDGRLRVIEHYRPSAVVGRRRAVMIVHGGFWRNRYDRGYLRPLAADLADAGIDVFLPEYRRVGDDGGGWPGSLDDVVAAIGAVRARLDAATPLVLAGHSAGGHLAMLAAQRDATGLRRVVSLGGLLDLAATAAAGLSGGAAAEFLGVDPAELVGADAAGLAHRIDPAADPMLGPTPACEAFAVHGEDDDTVPAEQSRRFVAEHPGARLVVLPGVGHYEPVDPESAVAARIRELLSGV